MFTHTTHLRVRYGETDQMGYVYYGCYASYFEVGRVEALRAAGFPYAELEAGGVMLPVTSLAIKFLLPGRYDDLLMIRTTIPELPTARIVFEYSVCRASDAAELATGRTELAFMNKATARPMRCPPEIVTALSSSFL